MRVKRSFAFIDLCGFTAFTEAHGDELAVVMLARLRSTLREIAARRGIRVAKWLGDGAILSSTETAPLATMLIEARHRLADTIPELEIRAGLDRGAVIMFEGDDYIGRSVNVAARLCAEAAPGEVLATVDLIDDLPVGLSFAMRGARKFKGFTEPVNFVALDTVERRPEPSVRDAVECSGSDPVSPELSARTDTRHADQPSAAEPVRARAHP